MDRRTLYAILATVLLVATATASAIVFESPDHGKQESFATEVIGFSSYNDPIFEITASDLVSAGYSEGDMFDVEFTDATVHKATLTHGYLGVFMFDTYLNTGSDGHLSAGSYWGMSLSTDVGSKATIRYC